MVDHTPRYSYRIQVDAATQAANVMLAGFRHAIEKNQGQEGGTAARWIRHKQPETISGFHEGSTLDSLQSC